MEVPTWKEWDAATWGDALVRYYFGGRDGRPVTRLPVSQEELARAAGGSERDAVSARESFLRAVRCTPATFRHRVSRNALQPSAWDRRDPPPFAAYLFFTCLAAASLDADIANEGVFRERLRQLLRHPVGSSYALTDLSLLWEALAEWLSARRNAGEPYHSLHLPDPGRMTLIGYSMRLAFPRREDGIRLRRIMAESGVGKTPTIPEAFQIIGRALEQFSPDFRHVFERARRALVAAREVPELHALWSAALEAAALVPPPKPPRIRYRLVAQEDPLGRLMPFVVVANAPSGPRTGAQFSSLDEPFGEFDHYVSAADGTTGLIGDLLLGDALEGRVPSFGLSPIPRVVREGVLLFQRVDSATWALAERRPSESRMRALVKAEFSTAFLRLLPPSLRECRPTRFEGWCEVGDFEINELADPRAARITELLSVRCLQRVEVGSQLHLVGGIRVDGGFLGIGGLLPHVHCAEAQRVQLFRQSDDARGTLSSVVLATLERDPERSEVFGWPDTNLDLEGAYAFVAGRVDETVAIRDVRFHARGLSCAYLGPTNPGSWLVEGGTADVDVPPAAQDAFLTESVDGPAPVVDTAVAEGMRIDLNASTDDDPHHDRLVEAFAALSVSRTGIAESELLEILQRIVPESPAFATWGVIRAWLEAGYFDCLARRRWRGRVYFARRPRLVQITDDGTRSTRVVLHGLSPYHLRAKARDVLGRIGARPLPAATLSSFVPAPLSWRLESVEHASEAAKELGTLELTGVSKPQDLAGDFDHALKDDAAVPPGYELQASWDWGAGRFRPVNPDRESRGVRIDYYTRCDGPDRYLVVAGDERRMTLSRSWALLDGFRRAGKNAFSPAGSVALLRSGNDGPYVPMPVARALALRSGVVAGPAEDLTAVRHYAYPVAGIGEQRWLLRWLSGAKLDESVIRRFSWLASAASELRKDAVWLPADLQQRLRRLHSIPEAHSLASQPVPRHLHPHLRRAIEMAES